MKQSCHVSVMIKEMIQGFKDCHLRSFCEGTLGAGGHAEALLYAHPEIETYIALDQDLSAHGIAKEVLEPFVNKIRYIHDNFGHLKEILKKEKKQKINGFFFDLGVSSMQLDQKERGFSFRYDAPLDMRMDASKGKSAATVLAEIGEKELGEILREYGEVSFWKRAAKAIVEERKRQPIETTKQLADLIASLFQGRGKLHPATLVFQALRIYVNRELEMLEQGLIQALDHLAEEGLIGVISFHSLEDRIVKTIFKNAASPIRDERGKKVAQSPFELVNKKPLIASREEVRVNPRARSAKLRWIKRK